MAPPDVSAAAAVDGPAVPLALIKPGQNAVVRFDGAANQQVVILFDAGPLVMSSVSKVDVNVLAPNEATVTSPSSTSLTSSDGFPLTLPTTGTYRVLVNPTSFQSGTASVRVVSGSAAAVSVATVGGPAVTVTSTSPGQNLEVNFNAVAGKTVHLHVSSTMDCDVQYRLWRPGDAHTMSGIFSFHMTERVSSSTIGTTGLHTYGFDPHCLAVGPISVQFYTDQTPLARTAAVNGSAVAVSTIAYQDANVTFAGTAGQRLAIQLSDSSYPVDRKVTYSLTGPSGSNVGISALEQFAPPGTVGYATLPSNGTYTLLVDPSSNAAGSLNLRVVTVPTAVIDSTTVPLEVVVPGKRGFATFDAVAGDELVVTFTAGALSGSVVTVVDPGGNEVINTTVSSSSAEPLTVDATGVCVVSYDAPDGIVGVGTVRVSRVAPPITVSTTIGASPVLAQIEQPGQSTVVSFPGSSGMRVVVRLTDATFSGSSDVILVDSAGQYCVIAS